MLKKLLARLRGPAGPAFVLPRDDELESTPSGLRYRILAVGQGRRPGPTERVTVHYAGWTIAGRPFDSSWSRGKPASFGLDRVIGGWTEGLQLLREGGSGLFVIPPELAYGARGAPPAIGPNATLVFHVDLLSVG